MSKTIPNKLVLIAAAPPEKGICGPTLVLLIALIPIFLFWDDDKRR